MADKLIFSKGLEKDLPKSNIVTGGLYYCTDTGNTYIGIGTLHCYHRWQYTFGTQVCAE